MKRVLLLLAVVQVLFLSCNVSQEMDVKLDGSGNISFRVEIHPIFREYLLDISDILVEDASKQVLFDLPRIQATIAMREGLTLTRLETPERDVLVLNADFDHLTDIVSESDAESVLTFTTSGNARTIGVHLTAANFRNVLSIAALDDSPLVDSFGPSETVPWTQEEYLENVSFALEENATVSDIKDMFLNAKIVVRVSVEGSVLSQKGGEIKDGQVVFTIPLLRVLTLTEPLDLEVRYR